MDGKYNGVTMKLRYLLPQKLNVQILSKKAQRKLEWIDWYLGNGKNARLTCRHFGISPDTFYRWWNRFDKKNLLTLEDSLRSRRPKRVRQMTTPYEYIRRVEEIRIGNIEKSKYEIQEELRREGIKLGTSTIQKVINRNPRLSNVQHRAVIKSHRRRSIIRLKAPIELKSRYPGSLVQIDTKHLMILHRKYYLFCAIDCKSRYAYIQAFGTGSSESGRLFLDEALKYFPFKIENVQTDNGSEYLLNFHKGCDEHCLGHFFTDPQCPKQNGRVERFIQTATYEHFNYEEELIDDLALINESCARFNYRYNYQRYHRALRYKTPAEVMQEVLDYVKV